MLLPVPVPLPLEGVVYRETKTRSDVAVISARTGFMAFGIVTPFRYPVFGVAYGQNVGANGHGD